MPVALSGRRVTVVEPHPSMVELLGEWATEEGVSDRVGVVQEPWPLAAPMAEQHDVVVCSHVLYPIEDVVPFVRALVASTRRACLITLRLAGIEQAPAGLFRELHGEDRVPQPGFADLCAVLFQQGLSFQSSTYETETTWSYADLDEAVAVLAESLLVAGRPEARRADPCVGLGGARRRRRATVHAPPEIDGGDRDARSSAHALVGPPDRHHGRQPLEQLPQGCRVE